MARKEIRSWCLIRLSLAIRHLMDYDASQYNRVLSLCVVSAEAILEMCNGIHSTWLPARELSSQIGSERICQCACGVDKPVMYWCAVVVRYTGICGESIGGRESDDIYSAGRERFRRLLVLSLATLKQNGQCQLAARRVLISRFLLIRTQEVNLPSRRVGEFVVGIF